MRNIRAIFVSFRTAEETIQIRKSIFEITLENLKPCLKGKVKFLRDLGNKYEEH